jgi:hypothetical protein
MLLHCRQLIESSAALMPNSVFDDPTIPPPGKRTGAGIESILPFLVRSLATKPQVHPQPEDTAYGDDHGAEDDAGNTGQTGC